jgi:hypothetical protein
VLFLSGGDCWYCPTADCGRLSLAIETGPVGVSGGLTGRDDFTCVVGAEKVLGSGAGGEGGGGFLLAPGSGICSNASRFMSISM